MEEDESMVGGGTGQGSDSQGNDGENPKRNSNNGQEDDSRLVL